MSVLSLSLVSCSSSASASCVDGLKSRSGSYRVVPDYYCDNGGSSGRYSWYYGGRTHVRIRLAGQHDPPARQQDQLQGRGIHDAHHRSHHR